VQYARTGATIELPIDGTAISAADLCAFVDEQQQRAAVERPVVAGTTPASGDQRDADDATDGKRRAAARPVRGRHPRGLALYDVGYANTAICRSAICYIDSDRSILRYTVLWKVTLWRARRLWRFGQTRLSVHLQVPRLRH